MPIPRRSAQLRRGLLSLLAALLLAVPARAQQPAPRAASLPALIAEAARRGCPNRDQPEAHRVWEAMRQRYSGPADSLTVTAATVGYIGRVAEERVGAFDVLPREVVSVRGEPVPGSLMQRGLSRVIWSRIIAHSGYAVSAPAGWPSVWQYPALEAGMAPHFIDPLFARRNSLSLQHRAGGALAITFCPARSYRRQPSIEGELLLNADTALVEAFWRHRTPEPHQQAGGRALFVPPGERGSVLLPERSVTFARDGDSFLEEVRRFVSWIVAADPPTLPH